MKKLILFAVILSVMLSAIVPASAAIYRGDSYSYNDYGEEISAPVGYNVEQIIYGSDVGTDSFSEPRDIYSDEFGTLIADTGNNRIVVLDSSLHCEKIISSVELEGETVSLAAPEGVCRTADGMIYICDTGNARILKLDNDNKVQCVFEKPNTELLEDEFIFVPQKVSVDTAGTVYVVANGMYQGLAEYDAEGNFTGFFGSNKIELTAEVLLSYYWKKILSKEQGQAMQRLIPIQYSNLFIDRSDFVYAVTAETDTSTNEVKRLSASGSDVLYFENSGHYDKSDFGDLEKGMEKDIQQDSRIIDVTVDVDGVISLLDEQRCRVFQYDKNGQLLCIFGNKGNQAGTFLRPSALTEWKDGILVVDAEKNSLTLFRPSNYTVILKKAIGLYNEGNFDDSIDAWQELLSENVQLSIANRGIGKAFLRQGEYKKSMECFKKGNDREGYSEALRESRKIWMRNNIVFIAVGVALLYVAFCVIRCFIKRKRKKQL